MTKMGEAADVAANGALAVALAAQRSDVRVNEVTERTGVQPVAANNEESLLPGGRGARRPGGVMPLSRDR